VPRKSPRLATPARRRLGLEALESRLNPGSGAFTNGTFSFGVSVQFNATSTQISQIESAFQRASDVLLDATDGQHKFGTVTLFNNSSGGDAAEFWIYSGTGQASAPRDKYHIRGYHANLFYSSNFTGKQGIDGDAYTIAQEFAHLAYGLEDGYAGPNGAALDAPIWAEGATLNYSLMDNFFTRGGRATGGPYTLNEFSVPSDADPNGDTWQSWLNGVSDWQTIASSRFPATMPAGLPISAAPASIPVTFAMGSGTLQTALAIDHSQSMNNTDGGSHTRLFFAKHGAEAYDAFTATGNGIAVVTFADPSEDGLTVPLTSLSNDTVRQSVSNSIAAIQIASNSGTDLMGGTLNALAQLQSQPSTGNEAIILLTDGVSVPHQDPSLFIPNLLAAGVTVYTIGTGASVPNQGEQDLLEIANATGGQYFRTPNSFDAQAVLLELSQQLEGNGLAGESPQGVLTGGTPVDTSVQVEAGANSVLFTAIQGNAKDSVAFTITSPSGKTYTTASSGSNVQVIVDPNNNNQQSIRILSPEAGTWKMSVSSAATTNGQVQDFAYIDHPGIGVQVGLSAPPCPTPTRW
jgi:hypothetical protein